MNDMLFKRMRIGIDARYLSHGIVGGVNTYIRNLTESLLASNAPYDYDIWIDDKCKCDIGEIPPGSQIRILPWKSPLSSLRNDMRLGLLMRRSGADVVHFPANYGFAPPGVPVVLTLHDAINILPYSEIIRGHEKQPRTMLMMSYLHLVTRRAVRHQPYVVTVSQHARREILRHADLKPERVQVVYSAANPAFRLLDEGALIAERARLQLREHVLLADAIKNPQATLAAFRRLPSELRARTSLVFFTRREPHPDVSVAARDGECTVLLQPSTDELVRLHNIADVFVFPSFIEGFGLPALEAMSCGSPVVASGAGSIPEIVGDGGLIVSNPNDAEHFSRQIASLLEQPELRSRLSARALKRAATFSWERAATETREAYVNALESSRSTRQSEDRRSALPV